MTATSSNVALVPDANLVLSGTGADRTLVITPAANQAGTATITVTVSDGTAEHAADVHGDGDGGQRCADARDACQS